MNTNTPLTRGQLCRRYRIEVLMAGVAYVAVLIPSIYLIRMGAPEPFRLLLALSPMVPAAFMVWSVFRHVTQMDELQRRIHTESFALSAAGTALLGLTYSFLEGDAGFPRAEAWWAWVSVAVIYAVSNLYLRRRYS